MAGWHEEKRSWWPLVITILVVGLGTLWFLYGNRGEGAPGNGLAPITASTVTTAMTSSEMETLADVRKHLAEVSAGNERLLGQVNLLSQEVKELKGCCCKAKQPVKKVVKPKPTVVPPPAPPVVAPPAPVTSVPCISSACAPSAPKPAIIKPGHMPLGALPSASCPNCKP